VPSLIHHLTETRRDLIYAARSLLKSPGFALVGIVSLGLGIGVTSTIFSEIHMLIFRDLPVVREPQQLVLAQGVSYPYFEEYRNQHNLFTGAAAFITGVPFSVAVNPTAKAERVFGQIVSPEYFPVFGVSAARGRVFNPAEDQPGEPPLVVVTDRFWRERLNSDPAAVGRVLRINGQSATIAGVAPKDFLGALPILAADLFIPTTAPARLAPELGDDVLHKRDAKAFSVLMRLAPGVALSNAQAALDTLTKHLDESSLDPNRDRKGLRVRLLPGGMILPIPRETRPILWGLWGTLVGLLLTIACMNLANMLLAKAGARRREIAIRLAIGASRSRLIRQLVTESILLSLCGGVAGIVLALWMTNLVSSMKLPGSIPFQFDIRPDWLVLVFTLFLSFITGIGFGLAPAFAATKADVAPALKEGGVSQMRGYKRFGMRNLMVVYQVAGSLMLLLITGFLVLGYGSLSAANAAFDTRTMYLMSLDPVRDGYTPDQAAAFFEKLPDRLRGITGVQSVSLASSPPFTAEATASDFTTNLGGDRVAATVTAASKQSVGAEYFAALNEKMLAGREFDDRDQRTDASSATILPVILNQTAAQGIFGNQSAIGQRITQRPQNYEVVGVVRDLKGPSIMPSSQAAIYTPITRRTLAHPPAGGLVLMIRSSTSGTGLDAVEGVRHEIAAIDPNITIFNIRTLSESLDSLNAYIRLGTVFYGGLGVFGLILASIGLAGVTAYAVSQRRKEIGIRMALGARKSQVLGLVLREGTGLVIAGSVLGFAGAMILARAMSAILNVFATVFHTGAADPKLIVGAPLLLAGLAMLACYLPARRSTEIDPLKALREE
jgi:predicted permease